MTPGDILRTIVLAEAAFTVVFASQVLWLFWKRAWSNGRTERYLIGHVVAMTAVMVGWAAYATGEMVSRYGVPITWRTPSLLVLFAVSGLWLFWMRELQDGKNREAAAKLKED